MKASRLTNHRKPPEELAEKGQLVQYIIVLRSTEAEVPLQHLLKSYPGINILQLLDQQTALVEMSDEANRVLSHDHPEILIEQNIRYTMHGAH